MTTSLELEATLPLQAPEAAFPINKPMPHLTYSVYALVKLDNAQMDSMRKALNANPDCSTECRWPPDGRHQHSTLKEVYDHHIGLRDSDNTVHPYFFIVVENLDVATVLIVNLKAPTQRHDAQSVIGVSHCSVGQAALAGANLDIGNMTWNDYKESEHEKFGGEGPYTNTRYYPTDPRKKRKCSPVETDTVHACYSLTRGGESAYHTTANLQTCSLPSVRSPSTKPRTRAQRTRTSTSDHIRHQRLKFRRSLDSNSRILCHRVLAEFPIE